MSDLDAERLRDDVDATRWPAGIAGGVGWLLCGLLGVGAAQLNALLDVKMPVALWGSAVGLVALGPTLLVLSSMQGTRSVAASIRRAWLLTAFWWWTPLPLLGTALLVAGYFGLAFVGLDALREWWRAGAAAVG